MASLRFARQDLVGVMARTLVAWEKIDFSEEQVAEPAEALE